MKTIIKPLYKAIYTLYEGAKPEDSYIIDDIEFSLFISSSHYICAVTSPHTSTLTAPLSYQIDAIVSNLEELKTLMNHLSITPKVLPGHSKIIKLKITKNGLLYVCSDISKYPSYIEIHDVAALHALICIYPEMLKG